MKQQRAWRLGSIVAVVVVAASGAGMACRTSTAAIDAVAAAREQAPARRGVPLYVPQGATAKPMGERAATLEVLGIPLVATARFPLGASAAVFGLPSLADRQFSVQLRRYLAGGGRALITDRLAQKLGTLPSQYADRVYVLRLSERGRPLSALPQDTVDSARNFLLHPLGLHILAPPRVLFRLVGTDQILVENWNPWAAGVKITFRTDRWPHAAALESDSGHVPLQLNLATFQVPPRSTRIFRVAKR